MPRRIAIGGVRLQPSSAIRQAGGSILVDNRPVFWPMTIEAVGDPSGMQVKLVGSPGYGRFSAFAQLYGIEFDVSAQETLNLPGGTGADLLFASATTDELTSPPTDVPATVTSPRPDEPHLTSPHLTSPPTED